MYPTHFAGSVCGKDMSGKAASTLGLREGRNPLLSLASEDEFVVAVTKDLPPKPKEMMQIILRNQGRA